MCKMLFSKKIPKNWTFGDKPIVNGKAKNKSKYNMEIICKLILTQILKIEDVELTVANNDSQIKIFDTDDFELQAMLIKTVEKNKYILLIRSNVNSSSILPIVCHEMIHLKQYYNNGLHLNNGTFTGKGKQYPGSTPYFDRPGEKEAMKDQYGIEKQVKKLY